MTDNNESGEYPGLVYLPTNRLLRFARLAQLNVRVDRRFHEMQRRTKPAWKSFIGCVRVAWKDAGR